MKAQTRDAAEERRYAAEAFQLGGDRAELALLNHPRLTRPQLDFVSSTERKLLWVGGNSIGKSWGHAWDRIHFARRTHPFRATPRGPVKLMIAGFSFAQMDPLLEKLWMMLPKGEISPKLYYSPGNGIKGFKESVIPFVSGPGKGSVIYLATYEQGANRIMGFQGHGFSMDEPPPASVYREAKPRLNRYTGELRLTMTPTLESPPLEYLQAEVEAGQIAMMKSSYNVENITIQGGLVPWAWKTHAQIAADIAGYAADERPMREHGAWDPVVGGRWLERVTDANYTDASLPGGTWYYCVAIDHGARPGREWATLCAANQLGEYWLLDESHSDTVTSMAEDADGILSMLARNGLAWHEVDHWIGDRSTNESAWGGAKSNIDLQHEIVKRLKISPQEARAGGLTLQVAMKERGSVRRGIALINTMAARGALHVRNRCQGFRKGQREWTGDKNSPLKDAIDTARYGLTALHDRQDLRFIGTFGRIE